MKHSVLPSGETLFINRLDELDTEGKKWLSKWSGLWGQDITQGRGDQWGDPKSEPMFLANFIANVLLKKQALLTESKPKLDVMVRSPGLYTTATVLKRTIEALWDELKLQIALEQSAVSLNMLGCFYWKTVWNPQAYFGNGDIEVVAIDPRMMRIDPAVTHCYDLSKAQYVIEDEVVPMDWVVKNYPKEAPKVEPNSNLSLLGTDTTERGFFRRWVSKRRADITDAAMPRVWIRRYWIQDPALDDDDRAMFPGGRLIIRTGDDVILNPAPEQQLNPYYDGIWPYDMMDNRPDIDHPFGRSDVEQLKRLQEAINRIGHTVVKKMVRDVDWIIADSNALTTDTITAMKQLEQVVIEKGAGRDVIRTPGNVPDQVSVSMIQILVGLIKELGGIADEPIPGAKGRVEMRSAGLLEGLEQAGQVLIRFQARRLENFFESVGTKLISRIFQFYTADRILTYSSADKVKEYFFEKDKLRDEVILQAVNIRKERLEREAKEAEVAGKPLEPDALQKAFSADDVLNAIKGAWQKFHFKVIPYTSLYTTRAQRAAQKMQLAELGLASPEIALEELGYDDPKRMMEEGKQYMIDRTAMGIPMPQAAPKGKGGKK